MDAYSEFLRLLGAPGAGLSALADAPQTVGLSALAVDPMGDATATLEARRRQQVEGARAPAWMRDIGANIGNLAGQPLSAFIPPELRDRLPSAGGLANLVVGSLPGSGDYMAARDAIDATGAGISALGDGDYMRAGARGVDALTALLGVLPMVPFLGSIKPIRAYHGSPHDIEVTQPYPQSYDAFVGGQKAGNMSVSSSGPFASPTVVEPDFRRKGVATALYDQAEKDMGRRMIPSPLGLSDDAVQFWRSRFAAMPEHEAAALIREAQAVGESMGVGKHSSERLAKAFPSYADAIRKYGIAGLIGAVTGAGIGSLYLDGEEGGGM